jgi:uncharacterized protein
LSGGNQWPAVITNVSAANIVCWPPAHEISFVEYIGATRMVDGNSNRAFVFYGITLGLAVSALMLIFIAPEGGFRHSVESLGLTTAGLKGWPLAIGGPVMIHALGLAILAAAGLTALVAPQVSGSVSLLVLDILAGFVISTMFALGEEVGWRGYMLPRMKGFGLVQAMLIVGFLHGVWHLPILLTTDYYHSAGNPWIVAPLFLLTVTLAGIFYGFLRIWTGSVWPAAIAHAAANTAWNVSSQVSQTKSPAVLEYAGGESGVIMIGGLLVINFVLVKVMRNSNAAI